MTEIISERPTPDELTDDAVEVEKIRYQLSDLRSRVDLLGDHHRGIVDTDFPYRDVHGLLTSALVLLYPEIQRLTDYAKDKTKKLADKSGSIEVRPGFWDDDRTYPPHRRTRDSYESAAVMGRILHRYPYDRESLRPGLRGKD